MFIELNFGQFEQKLPKLTHWEGVFLELAHPWMTVVKRILLFSDI